MKAYELRKKSEAYYYEIALKDQIKHIDALLYDAALDGYFALTINKVFDEYESDVINYLLEEGYNVTSYNNSGNLLITWFDATDPNKRGTLTNSTYFYADELLFNCFENNIKVRVLISEEDLFDIQDLLGFIPEGKEYYDLEDLIDLLEKDELIEGLINYRGYKVFFNDEQTVCTIKYCEEECEEE